MQTGNLYLRLVCQMLDCMCKLNLLPEMGNVVFNCLLLQSNISVLNCIFPSIFSCRNSLFRDNHIFLKKEKLGYTPLMGAKKNAITTFCHDFVVPTLLSVYQKQFLG